MHTITGRWGYGLFLALLTALLWGILPIKLKQVLQVGRPGHRHLVPPAGLRRPAVRLAGRQAQAAFLQQADAQRQRPGV
ncbi:hypothetical protein PPS11_26119 [Pseudomonas putida S11]|nr:hypothetical protein PPS11_26119 [Pseudomonas putida S11]